MLGRQIHIPQRSYIRRVADTAERDAIPRKYYGLEVFVLDALEIHVWNNVSWDVVSGGGSMVNTPDVLIDCGTITAPSENVLIDCGTIV